MKVLSLNFVRKSLVVFLISIVIPAIVELANVPALAQTTSTWSGGSGEWAPCPNAGGNALWDTCSQSTPEYPDGNYNAVIDGGPVTLSGTDGDTIVNLTLGSGGSVDIIGGYVFITGNSISNNGTITITNGNGLALIGQGAIVTLSGGGTVNMNSSLSNFDGTAGSSPTLINQQTIMGQGSLGKEGFSIQNQGTINAVGGLLTVQPSSAGIINTGTFEASSGATLDVTYGFLGPFNNTGGTIKALDGGVVQLQGEIYTGGTLTTVGSGVIQLTGGTVLNGLTNSGLVQITSNLGDLQNTVTNTGTIQLDPGTLSMLGSVTLTGSGSLIMSGSSILNQNSAGGSLTNQQLIHGSGTISELPVTNQGTITADSSSNTLTLAGGATANTGTLEASGGGTLELETVVNNSGGTIEALAGSTVILNSGFNGSVNGGTLKTSGTGVIESQDGMLDGTVNIPTNAGKLTVPNGQDLFLQGTINNTGTITLSGHGCIILNQPTILTGTGKVILGSGNCIYGSGNSLTNESTIEGAGTIGDSNPMPIINDGTILANNKTNSLTIVSNGTGFTNNGKLTVNSGSTLIINSISGPFNNLVGGTLTGGAYTATGMLEVGSAITTNAASITLTGPSAEILSTPTTNALAALGANATTGVLSLQTGQALTTGTNFSNAGKTTVGAGSSFTVGGTFTQTAGTTTVDGTLTAPSGLNLQKGTLEGKGTLAAPVSSNATVIVGDATTKAGLLTVTGSYSQETKGILKVAIGGTAVGSQYSQMAVSNGVSLGGTLTIKLINSFTPTIGEVFTILTGSAVTGQFATVTGATINSGEHFEVGYTATGVTLTVVSVA
jgi:fibronectin-binding autotransporter adhesin